MDALGYEGDDETPGSRLCWAAFMLGLIAGLLLGVLLIAMP